jgi:hypothetical protein
MVIDVIERQKADWASEDSCFKPISGSNTMINLHLLYRFLDLGALDYEIAILYSTRVLLRQYSFSKFSAAKPSVEEY